MLQHVDFTIKEDGLHITLTQDGREEKAWLRKHMAKHGSDSALATMTEYQRGNGWDFGTVNELGALSEAPYFSEEIERDDQDTITKVGTFYYNPNYMVENEVEILLTKGEIVFKRFDP